MLLADWHNLNASPKAWQNGSFCWVWEIQSSSESLSSSPKTSYCTVGVLRGQQHRDEQTGSGMGKSVTPAAFHPENTSIGLSILACKASPCVLGTSTAGHIDIGGSGLLSHRR